jgi:hypothetical protein
MKPMTLFQPFHRLREWATTFPYATGDLQQVQADALHVLNRHDLLHRMADEREKHIWYQQGTEGNGNVDISWQERAEQMEARLRYIETHMRGTIEDGTLVLAITFPAPETDGYEKPTFLATIDEAMEREGKP